MNRTLKNNVKFNAESVQPDLFLRLGKQFENNKLHSSLLFAGKKGVGKWLIAHELSKLILCLDNNNRTACNGCFSCKQIHTYSHPDIQTLFPAPKEKKTKNDDDPRESYHFRYLESKRLNPFVSGSDDVSSFITIDSIREFQRKLNLKPSLSKNKVGIIYEAERMLPAAMDALLKIVEEPPNNCYLIISTDQPQFLTATMHSRLSRINFPLLTIDILKKYLQQQQQLSEEEISVIAHHAVGSFAKIAALVDGDFFKERETAFKLFESACQQEISEFGLKFLERAPVNRREDVEKMAAYWLTFLRDIMIMKTLPEDEYSIDNLINFDFHDRFQLLSGKSLSLNKTEELIDKLEDIKLRLRRNVRPAMAAFSFLKPLASNGN